LPGLLPRHRNELFVAGRHIPLPLAPANGYDLRPMGNELDRFGPFTFDRRRMLVTKEGDAVPIGARGAALLGALLDARGWSSGVVFPGGLLCPCWS
jgi:hypothetical protein